jgi:hypothetical protein
LDIISIHRGREESDERKVLPYKLIGDAACSMQPWFYSPFKGEKEGLPRYKQHLNFI